MLMKTRMRVLLSALLCLVLVASLAACSSSAPASDAPAGSSAAPEAAASEAAPAEAEFNIKLSSSGTPGDGLVEGCYFMERELEARSGGRIAVEVFTGGQLGGYAEQLAGLQMGSIQVAEINVSVLGGTAPKFEVFNMPYLATSVGSLQETLRGPAGQILSDDLEANSGVLTIGWLCRPARSVYSAVGPITQPSDFEGLKIRTMESAPMLKAMEMLGASPTPIPTAERYLALQTGVVDAAENNLVEIYVTKEFEVTDYLSITEHTIVPHVFCVSRAFLDTLPQDLQDLVLQVGLEAGDEATRMDQVYVSEALDKLKNEGGMIVNEIPDKSAFVELLAPLHEEYKEQITEELLTLFHDAALADG